MEMTSTIVRSIEVPKKSRRLNLFARLAEAVMAAVPRANAGTFDLGLSEEEIMADLDYGRDEGPTPTAVVHSGDEAMDVSANDEHASAADTAKV